MLDKEKEREQEQTDIELDVLSLIDAKGQMTLIELEEKLGQTPALHRALTNLIINQTIHFDWDGQMRRSQST